MKRKPRLTHYYQQLLATILEFMLLGGVSPRVMRRTIAAAIRDSQSRVSALSSPSKDLFPLARIVETWHRNRLYVDKDAKLKAIPLRGRAPSIEALIKAEKTHQRTDLVVKRLKASGVIVRCGSNLYKPTTNVVVVPELDSYLQQHVASTLAMFLRTIKRNVSVKESSEGLIERRAEVIDLPLAHEGEFRRFAKKQASALLERVNDWLESRRLKSTPKRHRKTIRAGVHVFAYTN